MKIALINSYHKKIIIFLFLIIGIITICIQQFFNKNKIILQIKNNSNFVIFIQNDTSIAGLFALYYKYLGCTNKYLNKGYIPLIDFSSFPNVYNSYEITNYEKNPWEYFFKQPFNYSLKDVKKYGKKNKHIICTLDGSNQFPNGQIYFNDKLRYFWHNISQTYLPIKGRIKKEAYIKKKYLFNGSKNVLGVLIRGTDYITIKPKGHAIQPSCEMYFLDIEKMDKQNKYDFIFITTEDDLIRDKFIKKFSTKLRFIKNSKIEYDYKSRQYINLNKNLKGNIRFFKIYLINIIILSECLDIICSITGGSIGAFILTKGFRNKIVYQLGVY